MPNQGPRQVFLYDHGRPHWSQGGPLFYDRRVPPPAPQMGNFHNPPLQGPSPQWLRGPLLGGPGPGPGANQQQFDGFGVLPWGNQNNYNRHNNRHHQGRNGGGVSRNNRMLVLNARNNHNNNRHQNNNEQEVRYLCFKCGDYLQNSPESGVHLCDGGANGHNQRQEQQQQNNNDNNEELQQQREADLQSRLKAFLEEAKIAMDMESKLSQEEIYKVCLDRAEKFLTLHSQLLTEQSSIKAQQESLEALRNELERRDTELAALEKRLEEDRSKFAKDCKKEREEIARKWQELKDEISRMEEMTTMQKGRIRLDVGGSVFTTSRLTLTRDSDSMLAAMFSGRHHVTQEDDGTVFIDRDGTHFRYILNYLRDGGVNQDSLPRDRQVLKELRNEAVYFQLNGLVQIIEKFL